MHPQVPSIHARSLTLSTVSRAAVHAHAIYISSREWSPPLPSISHPSAPETRSVSPQTTRILSRLAPHRAPLWHNVRRGQAIAIALAQAIHATLRRPTLHVQLTGRPATCPGAPPAPSRGVLDRAPPARPLASPDNGGCDATSMQRASADSPSVVLHSGTRLGCPRSLSVRACAATAATQSVWPHSHTRRHSGRTSPALSI